MLFTACLLLMAQTAVDNGFRIHVVNSVTGTPIPGAGVVLSKVSGDPISGQTDASGTFASHAHDAGSFLITVTRHGYRLMSEGLGKMIELRSGTDNDATVRMLPLGVIAGRIVDQYGDPVRSAVVRTEDKLRAPGQADYYQSYWSAVTDDRGEYRIADVEPGKHYLAAEFNSITADRDAGVRSTYQWPLAGGLVLFPDASEIDRAQQVDVSAGEVLRIGDLRLKIQRPAAISGHIQSSSPNSQLQLKRLDGLALHSSPVVQAAKVETDGRFTIEALPGYYLLTAADYKTGRESKPITLEVRDKDIAGLELLMTSGYDIQGRVTVDGTEQIDFSKLFVNLGGAPAKVDSSGLFQTAPPGGKGRFILQGLPDGWFVEGVSVAGKRIDGRQFAVESGSTEIAITLNPRGASVSVRPRDAGADMVAAVALLREDGEGLDPESIPAATNNGTGKFTMPSVPPGTYRVFVLDASSYLLIMRPDKLMQDYRNAAPIIKVAEGERRELTVPVLKIEPR